MPIADPVTLTDAPRSRCRDRATSSLLSAGDNALLLAAKSTLKGRGRGGSANETGVGGDEAARYVPSLERDTVTRHVPVEVAESVLVAETAHPLADPSTTLKNWKPVPEPPDEVSVSGVPSVARVEVTVRGACVAKRGDMFVMNA